MLFGEDLLRQITIRQEQTKLDAEVEKQDGIQLVVDALEYIKKNEYLIRVGKTVDRINWGNTNSPNDSIIYKFDNKDFRKLIKVREEGSAMVDMFAKQNGFRYARFTSMTYTTDEESVNVICLTP